MGRIISCLTFLVLFQMGMAQTGPYSLIVQDAPLSSVLDQLENRYELRFSYAPEILEGIVINGQFSSANLSDFLKQVVEGTGIEFQVQDGGYVALRRRLIRLQTICGTVVDSASNEPLAYAQIRLASSYQGKYTNAAGVFSLQIPAETFDTLIIQYGGYQTLKLETGSSLSSCPTLALAYKGFESEAVIIEDYLTDGISLGGEGEMVLIKPKKASVFPGQATPDVFHSIRFLPGISSPSGELSQMYVRGGTPDQSLVMWEGIPLYHTAHYFGMISAINPYFVDEVRVYRGSFGANLGGRIAGIVDMHSGSKPNVRPRVGGGVDMMHAFAQGETFLAKQRLNLSFSLRRSISDLWQSPTYAAYTNRIIQGNLIQQFNSQNLPNKIGVTTNFQFWDGHIKAKADLSKKDQLTASVFRMANVFDAQIQDTLPSGSINSQTDSLAIFNDGISLKWEHRWNRDWSSSLQGLSTRYSLDYAHFLFRSSRPRRPNEAERENELSEQQIHLVNTYDTQKGLRVQLGYQMQHFNVFFLTWERDDMIGPGNRASAFIHTVYGTLRLAQNPKYGAEVGTRLSLFSQDNRVYPEPRLKGWVVLGKGKRIYAHLGRYQQFVSQLTELRGENIGMQPTVWFLSDTRDLQVMTSYHGQIGTILEKGPWLVDIQGYLRSMDGLSLRTAAIGFDLPDDKPIFGTGLAKGIDVLVKWRNRTFKTWLSYSLAQVNNQYRQLPDPDFAAPHDVRHQLNWVGMIDYKNWQVSLSWMGRSGTPYTEVVGLRLIPQDTMPTGPMPGPTPPPSPPEYLPEYDEINGQRLAFHHTLNTSIQYHIGSRTKQGPYGIVGLSIQNVYNAENVFLRTYFLRRREMNDQYVPVDRLDLGFTPNVTLQFFW